MKKITLLTAVIFSLVGCQQFAEQKHEYIRNRSKDYLSSFVIEPLQIPAELAHPTTTENFPVPETLPAVGSVARVSLVPPGFGVISEPTS